ncbi:MAG: hypothetical protein QFX35_05715 [Candidatus Verstraetearchaeota archaeon]|nr:hypothetical protein [Candidatus Verstraetearchaeota archaeon]
MEGIDFLTLSGKRTLLRGGVGTGKTFLLEKILEGAINAEEGSVTVIDMAPDERFVGVVKVGGKLKLRDARGARYLTPAYVHAPRVEGKDKRGVVHLAELNAKALEPLLRSYLSSPTPVLFINDMSIFLHRGRLYIMKEAILTARTFVGSAYWGTFFDDKGSGINERERALLEQLMVLFDRIIDL